MESQARADDPSQRVDLHDHLRAIRRRWRVVVLVCLLAVGVGLAFSARQTPSYLATTEILVEPTEEVTRTTSGIVL